MCGRFNVNADPLTILLMELVALPHPGPDNYNAAPTETIRVLRQGESGAVELVPMRWWLTPFWSDGPSTRYSMFNAKSETAHKSPAFREPLRKRRCVVPVSGFYEWVRTSGQKLPYYIHSTEHEGLLLAGLWDRWVSQETGEVLESFAVLTAAAAEGMKFVHTRQPVMLSMDGARAWLDPDNGDFAGLLGSGIPDALDAVPVSSHVNNARHKDPRCIEPVGDPVAIAAVAAAGASNGSGRN